VFVPHFFNSKKHPTFTALETPRNQTICAPKAFAKSQSIVKRFTCTVLEIPGLSLWENSKNIDMLVTQKLFMVIHSYSHHVLVGLFLDASENIVSIPAKRQNLEKMMTSMINRWME
jgi:hypothetical protein